MSSTKKVVIIFGSIFLASVIGIGVTLGILIGSVGGFKNIGDIRNIFDGYMIEVDESSAIDLARVSNITIEADSADIHIVPSDAAKVELKGKVAPGGQRENYLGVTMENGELLISVKNDSWHLFNFDLLSVFEDLDLTVYLPEESMLDVSVHCSSGNTDIAGMKLGSVEVRGSSGNITVRDCTAESFTSDMSSGDTRVETSGLGGMKMTCRSGSISVSGTTGTIYARSTSGNIIIEDASDAIDAGCTSGDIDITGARGTVNAEGTSGGISIDVAEGPVPPITVGLTSGNVKIYMPMSAAFDLEANTTSGNIRTDLGISVSGSLDNNYAGDNISGKCNGGGLLVSLRVTSGNIDIIGK